MCGEGGVQQLQVTVLVRLAPQAHTQKRHREKDERGRGEARYTHTDKESTQSYKHTESYTDKAHSHTHIETQITQKRDSKEGTSAPS